MLITFGYSHATACSAVAQTVAPLPGLRLLLGYRNYYAIHRSPYTSTHVLIENTLVQHKMAKNSRMALCCQNRVSKGTNRRDGLHSSASVSVHSTLVMELGLLKKKKHSVQNGVLAVFRLAT